MTRLARETERGLLAKGWLTHDAMWFMHCMRAVGMAKTNEINRAAVRSMAQVEIKRLRRALGVQRITDLEQYRAFMDQAMAVVGGDFMDFRVAYEPPDTVRAHMVRCFAHDGMARLGVIDQYECGIFTRIDAWLEGLGVSFEAGPELAGCMMHRQGRCARTYALKFPA